MEGTKQGGGENARWRAQSKVEGIKQGGGENAPGSHQAQQCDNMKEWSVNIYIFKFRPSSSGGLCALPLGALRLDALPFQAPDEDGRKCPAETGL